MALFSTEMSFSSLFITFRNSVFNLIKNVANLVLFFLNSLLLSEVWIDCKAEPGSFFLTIKYAWILSRLVLYCTLTVTWEFLSGPRECPQLFCNNKVTQLLPTRWAWKAEVAHLICRSNSQNMWKRSATKHVKYNNLWIGMQLPEAYKRP